MITNINAYIIDDNDNDNIKNYVEILVTKVIFSNNFRPLLYIVI